MRRSATAPRRFDRACVIFHSDVDQEMSGPPNELEMGQQWAAWVPGRQQWLLASIVQQKDGRVTLKFDARYGLGVAESERKIDEQDLLGTPNLFRRVAG